MTDHGYPGQEVDQFLQDQIDTVPHLEALLLLWNSRPKSWSAQDMARGLFVSPDAARNILDDLVRRRLITSTTGAIDGYRYEPDPDRDRLISSLDSTYRRELIRISRMIHSKPSPAIREFARAFRLKKDNE